MNTINEITTQIQNGCREYYELRTEINNLICQTNNSLVKDKTELLGDLSVPALKFLNYLWEEPKIVAILLSNSNKNEVKEYLAPFICNNFYQNIISPYTIEENLLYVIALMLKEEINKLNSINQLNSFLDKTPCGYLLWELRNKSDIQTFSKNIIYKFIEEIEAKCSDNKLNLNILNIVNGIKETEKNLKRKKKNINNLEDLIFVRNINIPLGGNEEEINFDAFKMNNERETDQFNEKYVSNLDKNELEKINNKKYKDNKNMSDYILKQRNKITNDDKLFTNENLINSIYESKYTKIIYFLYEINFLKTTKFLDILLKLFLDNVKILPKSLKYICKIISILIKKKFPEIIKSDENAFISRFLFINLLFPLFNNINLIYINNLIISETTLYNMNYLLDIFKKLILGEFFDHKVETFHLTPFNWYFIRNMENIFKLFEDIIDIKFPLFFEKFINNQLPNDYRYEYFNEHPEEKISHKSICFSLNDLNYLIKNMEKCKGIIFPEFINKRIINDNDNDNDNDKDNDKNQKTERLYKIFQRLNNDNNRAMLYSMRQMEDFEIVMNNNKNVKKPNLSLLEDLLKNPKIEYLFNIKQIKPYFYLKELNEINDENDTIKNNIIKAKNYLSGLLYNCRDLEKSDFSLQKNTLDILEEMRIYLKTSEFVIDNTLPYEWYINSLLECLKKIPQNLAENDFEKLYNELEEDINKSIQILDFYKMCDCFEKVKYVDKSIDFYKLAKNNIKDIDINRKVKGVVLNNSAPVEMMFKYNFNNNHNINNNNRNKNENGFWLLTPSNTEKNFEEMITQVKKNSRICLNIEQFIQCFPNFVKMQLKKDIKILDVIRELEIPTKINDYIDYVLKKVSNQLKFSNNNDYKDFKNKLFDYILIKLHDKLYPAYPEEADINILKNCYKLSWCECKHFIKNKKNNFDIILDDIKKQFNQLEIEKSPRKKMLAINQIFKTIEKILQFNEEDKKSGAADDILLILQYLFVRIQPKKIFTDIEYAKLFMNDNNGLNQYQLVHLTAVCQIYQDFSYVHLNGVTEQEFNEKCQQSIIKQFKGK